jgi:hypothetical protein
VVSRSDFEDAYENSKAKTESDDDFDVYEEIIEKNYDLTRTAYDNDEIYCGRCPSQCRDDETMGDFKTRVQKEVEELLDQHKVEYTNMKFSWLSEAWHD